MISSESVLLFLTNDLSLSLSQHDDSIISIHGDIVYPDKNSIICR